MEDPWSALLLKCDGSTMVSGSHSFARRAEFLVCNQSLFRTGRSGELDVRNVHGLRRHDVVPGRPADFVVCVALVGTVAGDFQYCQSVIWRGPSKVREEGRWGYINILAIMSPSYNNIIPLDKEGTSVT